MGLSHSIGEGKLMVRDTFFAERFVFPLYLFETLLLSRDWSFSVVTFYC